jgi:hypothetical protein
MNQGFGVQVGDSTDPKGHQFLLDLQKRSRLKTTWNRFPIASDRTLTLDDWGDFRTPVYTIWRSSKANSEVLPSLQPQVSLRDNDFPSNGGETTGI